MAKRKFRPQPGQVQPQSQQVKVDLNQADTMKCEYCGNVIFIKATVIKRISALMSPTGQEALMPIEVYSCGSCGQVPKTIMNDVGLDTQPTEDNNPSIV
tara:strand:+ start:310 stop:606 length:297 start_codon:yes stop_codon:yes gene_type:complete